MTKTVTVCSDERWSKRSFNVKPWKPDPRYKMGGGAEITFMSFQLEDLMASRYEAGELDLMVMVNTVSFINECDGLTFKSIRFVRDFNGEDTVVFQQMENVFPLGEVQCEVTIGKKGVWIRVGDYWDVNKTDEMQEKRIFFPHTAGTYFCFDYKIDIAKILPAVANFLRKKTWHKLIENVKLFYGDYAKVSKWFDKMFNKAMLPEHQTLHPNSNAYKEQCARWEAEWRERLAA